LNNFAAVRSSAQRSEHTLESVNVPQFLQGR